VRGLSIYNSGVVDLQHPFPTSVREVTESHAGQRAGGNLRAAVFGVNDGLVSNVSLILGMAGATEDAQVVMLAGLAGLLAGAFSMAAGEYVSVRSQREFHQAQIALERAELELYPEEEAEELALIYNARGLPMERAREFARDLLKDPDHALDTLSREELGLDPEDLGSPWGAALFSFLSFAAGALIPVLPFVLGAGDSVLAWTLGLSGLALFGVGASLSLFTGRNPLVSGLRMLMIGAGAGLVTWLLGSAIGTQLG
jgi:VIT1/CCC1 family predicted Fe2+/Mn2+ transporter